MSGSTPNTPPDRGSAPGSAAAARRCPACDADVTDNVTSSGYCRMCSHDLVGTAPPPRWKRGNVDLRVVARRQRHVIWTALALLAVNSASVALPILAALGTVGTHRVWNQIFGTFYGGLAIASIAAGVAAAVVVTRLAAAMGMNVILIVLHAILALAPCVGILCLISVSSQATTMLRREGLRVALLGVSEEDLERLLEPSRCRSCGYILARGVPMLQCPECGTRIERHAT